MACVEMRGSQTCCGASGWRSNKRRMCCKRGKVALFASAPLENSAEVLARRARDLAVQFSYVERPADTAYGFARDIDLLS